MLDTTRLTIKCAVKEYLDHPSTGYLGDIG
jgi:hypothetical protein